jgi:hypothetical protein
MLISFLYLLLEYINTILALKQQPVCQQNMPKRVRARVCAPSIAGISSKIYAFRPSPLQGSSPDRYCAAGARPAVPGKHIHTMHIQFNAW